MSNLSFNVKKEDSNIYDYLTIQLNYVVALQSSECKEDGSYIKLIIDVINGCSYELEVYAEDQCQPSDFDCGDLDTDISNLLESDGQTEDTIFAYEIPVVRTLIKRKTI